MRISDVVGVYHLFGLENGVDAFRRDDGLSLVVENEWRILPIKHHNIDLLTEVAVAVDYVSRCSLIALRQIFLKQL